ncbi:hypothetical protein PM082_004448 [Marasmius tenuissimus]|nr:hypothetical protein PM082_004448 [Marasmius tenuissimus]
MASEQEIARKVTEPFTSVQSVIAKPIATLSLMFLVYGGLTPMLSMLGLLSADMGTFAGMYIIIFGLSINVLWYHRESSASRAYTRWIIALFVLNTICNAAIIRRQTYETLAAFNAIKTRNHIPFFEYLAGRSSLSASATWTGLQVFSSGISCCIFDYLMIHRCYVIWGYSKWVLYPFAFVAIITDAIGLVCIAVSTSAVEHNRVALYNSCVMIQAIITIISAVYASLLTLLTAGHIWWTVHQVGQITGSRVYTKYKIFIATILESGLLYSGTAVVGTILPLLTDPENNGLAPFDFGVVAIPMTGIAPTVIILRIAYGQAVESVQQMVSTLQFAEGVDNSQQQSASPRGIVDPQQPLPAVEEGTAGRIMMNQNKPLSNVAENMG